MSENEERPAAGQTAERGAVCSLTGERTNHSPEGRLLNGRDDPRRAPLPPHLSAEATSSAIDELTAVGLRVLPLRPGDVGMFPGMGLIHSTTEAGVAVTVFGDHAEANVGVVSGRPSSVFLLKATTAEGAQTLASWEMSDLLPSSWRHSDPTGAAHIWLRYPASRRLASGEIAPGVDLIAEGVIVAPPSITDLGTYAWDVRPSDAPLAEAPDWLIDLAPPEPHRQRPERPDFDEEDDDEVRAFDLRERARRWARPYVFRPINEVPAREWLYPGHLLKGIVSATVADSGVGKSTLLLGEALAMMSGYPILGVMPRVRTRVWYWNGEDPDADFERRLHAAIAHHGLSFDDIEGQLVTGSGYQDEMIVARGAGDIEIDDHTVDAIVGRIRALNVGLMIIDPLKSAHLVAENDNTAMDRLIKGVWSRIARETGCGIELVHHTRKTGGHEATVDDSRGAAAVKAAARSMRVVRQMTEVEAASFGIEAQDQPSYVRVETGKSNLTRTGRVAWFRLVNVPLSKTDDLQGAQAIEPWSPPDPFSEVSGAELRVVQKVIAAGRGESGDGWRANIQAGDAWVGCAIAQALSLDLAKPRQRERVRHLIDAWLSSGAVRIVHKAKDAKGKTAPFIEVGAWADG